MGLESLLDAAASSSSTPETVPVAFRITVEGMVDRRFIPMVLDSATKITPMDGGTLTIQLGEEATR